MGTNDRAATEITNEAGEVLQTQGVRVEYALLTCGETEFEERLFTFVKHGWRILTGSPTFLKKNWYQPGSTDTAPRNEERVDVYCVLFRAWAVPPTASKVVSAVSRRCGQCGEPIHVGSCRVKCDRCGPHPTHRGTCQVLKIVDGKNEPCGCVA